MTRLIRFWLMFTIVCSVFLLEARLARARKSKARLRALARRPAATPLDCIRQHEQVQTAE